MLDYQEEYYEDNKDQRLEYQSKYYEENKDQKLDYQKEYYKDNKDQRLEYQRIYHQNQKQQRKEYKKLKAQYRKFASSLYGRFKKYEIRHLVSHISADVTGLSRIMSMDVAGKMYHSGVKSVKIQCSSSNSMGIGGTALMRSMPCIAYRALK